MNIAIVGKGWIGSMMSGYFDDAVHTEGKITTQLEAFDALSKVKQSHGVEVVVNAAGKTGRPNVDWCETNKGETFFHNTMLPFYLATACRELGLKFVHISSGCVYEGDNDGKGFSETDEPNFERSFYSFTKKVTERMLQEFPETLMPRVRIPLSTDHDPRNIIEKLIKYKDIILVPNSITVLPEFLTAVDLLIETGKTGIWNVVSPQPITHQRILELYAKVMNDDTILSTKNFIDPDKLDVLAPRSNCVLNASKLNEFVLQKDTENAVVDALIQYSKQ